MPTTILTIFDQISAEKTRSSLSDCPSRTAAASSGNVRGLQRINQHPASAIARSLKCVAQVAAEGRQDRLQCPMQPCAYPLRGARPRYRWWCRARTAHPSTGCAHRRENFFAASTRPARDVVRRILDMRRPGQAADPQERDLRIDLEHNVMAMR